MTIPGLVFVLLVAHFIGDFVCQSDWVAISKSKRWDALGWHVLVYSIVLGVCVSFTQAASEYPYTSLKLFCLWWGVNGAAHFVQDAITSRINARLWFFQYVGGGWIRVEDKAAQRADILVNPWEQRGGNRHWFFVGIGADQLLHYVTLFVTADWWLR